MGERGVNITFRLATPDDAGLISRQRILMFAEHRAYPEAELAHLEQAYTGWVQVKLANGEYRGWLAETDTGEVVAGVGLWLREYPPILNNYTGRQGYVENVYTVPAYRRQGIARQLMVALLDWVRDTQIAYEIQLHPTEMARPLYEALGFKPDVNAMTQWVKR